MIWNEHYEIEDGAHAFLSPSNYHWTRYDDEKLKTVYRSIEAKKEGVEEHLYAALSIKKKRKLARIKQTLNMYVNDCIAYNMRPEQKLKFSENAHGTADAISFVDGILRIFDLKTGQTKVSFQQLNVYAAYFCLEYGINPEDITIIERIYQNREILEYFPTAEEIRKIMDRTCSADQIIETIKLEYV